MVPWGKPRYELLLLVLVGVAALSPVQRVDSEDASRMCQTDAFVHFRITADTCLGHATGVDAVDRSFYDGHYYATVAPGMAALAIPAYEAIQLSAPSSWHMYDLRLWFVRAVTAGAFFILGAFLVGRVAEGLAPGFGAPALASFALGTLALSLAADNFDHVPAMALGFAAFLLLWSRRPLAAGLVTGLALLVEYQMLTVVIALGAYALWLGRRPLLRYAAGVVPGAALLGAYDWAAFGEPWRNPLRYSNDTFNAEHSRSLLVVHAPNLHAARLVFLGDRGLLVTSPVLVLAAAGLVLLWRRGLRAEVLVCAAVTAALLLAECGYFDPYGGLSPGPRYFIPALAFLAVGLGPAFARWRWITLAAAAASVVAQTALVTTWSAGYDYAGTVWTQIAKALPHHTHSLLYESLTGNVFEWLGPSRLEAVAIDCAFAAAACVVAAASMRR